MGITCVALRLLVGEGPMEEFQQLAEKRWDFGGFYSEAAELGAQLGELTWLPARVGAELRKQPELRELLADLPASEAGDLAAWRKGLELLWDAGGGSALRTAMLGK